MLEKLTILRNRAKNAISYYWKGFLVKIGLTCDHISVKTRKIPGTETEAGYTCEIITRNERTKEERKTRALVFSQKAMEKIYEARENLEARKYQKL